MVGLDAELVRVKRSLAVLASLLFLTTAGCGSSSDTSAAADCPRAVATPLPAAQLREGPPPVPATGAYLGAAVYDASTRPGGRVDAVAPLERAICRPLDIVHSYLRWQAAFPSASQLAASQAGQLLLVSWTGDDMARMASGADDTEIAQVAAAVAALRTPVFLELRWEMDRPNLASVVHSPATFIAAWDRAHRIFADHDATNASWVWCPTSAGFDAGRAQPYYPGADEVDWICTDAYPDRAGTLPQLSEEMRTFLDWARPKGKPLMLGEFGVPQSYSPQVRAQWLRRAAEFLPTVSQLKAVVIFDVTLPDQPPDKRWLLERESVPLQAFRALATRSWFSPRAVPTAQPAPPG